MYSRFAKKREDVGKATVLGFLSVLALFAVITIISYGILPQEQIAKLRQPSVGSILEAVVGPWGSWFIVVGLIISVLGAYLAWSLMSAEVLFTAAQDSDLPRFLAKTNRNGAPANALLLTTGMIQVLLVIVYFASGALDFMLDLTAALSLAPFALVGMYALKIAITRDGYAAITPAQRTRDLVVAALTVMYALFLIYAAGVDFVLLACVLLAPATVLYAIARREQKKKVFTTPGWIVFALVVVGAVLGIVGMGAGWITI